VPEDFDAPLPEEILEAFEGKELQTEYKNTQLGLQDPSLFDTLQARRR
jgi:hypothetical protein